MPYTLDSFPVETSEPRIEVELPIGTYTFELVVEDSAGLKSIVDTVTITVTKEPIPLPILESVSPSFVTLGKKAQVTVSGKHLATVQAVRFWRGENLEPRLTAVIDSEPEHVNEEYVIVTVEADAKAPVKGAYDVEVITQAGSARLPVSFRVVPEPKVSDFAPKSLGLGEDAYMLIKGSHLRMEDRPISEHAVEFLIRNTTEPDPDIEARIQANESTAESLSVIVRVRKKGGKVVPGARLLRVTTPAGSVVAKSAFDVTPD